MALSATALLGGLATTGTGCSADDGTIQVDCASTKAYFAEEMVPILDQECSSCHSANGLAQDTEFVLKSSAEAGFIQHNLDVVANVASLERDGVSQILLKPTGQVPHEGSKLFEKGSTEYNKLLGLVVRLKNEEVCEPTNTGAYTGVEQLDEFGTLRKAAILLVGRLPTDEEVARVEEGGFVALQSVLDEMMTEEMFYNFIRTTFNDLFTTDFYLRNDASGILDDAYADPFWYETADKSEYERFGLPGNGDLERYTEWAIAREPLELIVHTVRNNEPFTNIMTAKYIMVSPLSARSYGIADVEFENPNDPLEFKPGIIPDFPHAGLLTSVPLWARHPSTPTNRNRHRARMILDWFLGTDVLRFAKRPIDQTTVISLNPTRDDPNCTVCHTTIDPLAGTLMSISDGGITDYGDDQDWHAEMYPPGFNGETLPSTAFSTGPQWVSLRVAYDERFAISQVYNVYRGLTGQEPLAAPDDYADPLYPSKFDAFIAQSNAFADIAAKFTADDSYDFKVIVKELILSPYFRAKNAVPLTPEQAEALSQVGMGHLLTPPQLHNKINAVLGSAWTQNGEPLLAANPRNPADLGRYQLFYGGVDSETVTKRITAPNGIMAAVAERMATEMSCKAVPRDFARAAEDRVLFRPVEVNGQSFDVIDLEPEKPVGVPVELAVGPIKEQIVYLHKRLLGETVTAESEEVERTYQLFLETWREGNEKMALEQDDEDFVGENLPFSCQVTTDPLTGEDLEEDAQVVSDEGYTVRAWMAVITYLLSDYQFLYE